jgi:hypothetical protein
VVKNARASQKNAMQITSPLINASLGHAIDTSVANQVNLLVVPEPATWALLAFSLTTAMVLPTFLKDQNNENMVKSS